MSAILFISPTPFGIFWPQFLHIPRIQDDPSPFAPASQASCEHAFVTSRGHRYGEFQRALKNVWVAEAVARDLPRPLSLEDAYKLTYLYAEKEQWDKFERAAMKWLRRYLDEGSPTLANFAKLVQSLEERTRCE
jgi:hypothetical protein